MRVINNSNFSYFDDPIRFLEFEEFEGISNDCKLYIGVYPYGSDSYGNIVHTDKDSIFTPAVEKKYMLSTEEQWNDRDSTFKFENYVEKIFTICPLAEHSRAKREYVFFPFNEKYAPKESEKKWDVIYTGNVYNGSISEILKTISTFNYRHVSFSHDGFTTNLNVSYVEKLDLIAKSRVNVVYNCINEDSPQLKTRAFEAAFSKTLILCKRDKFQTLERWFTPEKEFIYYDTDELLSATLAGILSNFASYQVVIDAAHKRATENYTTKNFIERYIGFK